MRRVYIGDNCIEYEPIAKDVKNINLRVRSDGSVTVSAPRRVSPETLDDFVRRKADFILRALTRTRERTVLIPTQKRYVSGETFMILGRGLRLLVEQGLTEHIENDGTFIRLRVNDIEDTEAKRRIVDRYLRKICSKVFEEILIAQHAMFVKYGIARPALRIREMKTRWGSCSAGRGSITLNSALIAASRDCIEYVVAHELCHLVHHDHSREFYNFLTMIMPDWRERKKRLNDAMI